MSEFGRAMQPAEGVWQLPVFVMGVESAAPQAPTTQAHAPVDLLKIIGHVSTSIPILWHTAMDPGMH